MRADPKNEKAFTSIIGELRVLSNEMREEHHERIINWIDYSPMRDGSTGQSLTMILPTRACKYALAKHGGCSMCTLPMDNPLNPHPEFIETLPKITKEIFEKKGGSDKFRGVKFYTSGSFLDRWELPVEVREKLLQTFAQSVDEITLETRCEFVLKKHIESMLNVVTKEKLIVAIGQETMDDEINKRSINKGHTAKQFERAVNLLHTYGIQVKGYILLKPLFMSEASAVEDALRSAKKMIDLGVQNISINPCYIGKKTLMEQLFKEGSYRPPWLWSVYHVTKLIKEMAGDNVRVISDPVAAGSERGPRNCGNCDQDFRSKLKSFSATQDLNDLMGLSCSCEQVYFSHLSVEHLANGNGTFTIFN